MWHSPLGVLHELVKRRVTPIKKSLEQQARRNIDLALRIFSVLFGHCYVLVTTLQNALHLHLAAHHSVLILLLHGLADYISTVVYIVISFIIQIQIQTLLTVQQTIVNKLRIFDLRETKRLLMDIWVQKLLCLVLNRQIGLVGFWSSYFDSSILRDDHPQHRLYMFKRWLLPVARIDDCHIINFGIIVW